jgi:hypothetical protein
MCDAHQPLATRFRAQQLMSNFPVTIYEAKFWEKLTKNFQKIFRSNLGRHG